MPVVHNALIDNATQIDGQVPADAGITKWHERRTIEPTRFTDGCVLPKGEIANGTLVRVLPEWAPAPAPVSVVYATKIEPPLRVRAYVDFRMEIIGRDLPWQTAR